MASMIVSKDAFQQLPGRIPAFMVDTIIADEKTAVIVYHDGQYVPVPDNGRLHRLMTATR